MATDKEYAALEKRVIEAEGQLRKIIPILQELVKHEEKVQLFLHNEQKIRLKDRRIFLNLPIVKELVTKPETDNSPST